MLKRFAMAILVASFAIPAIGLVVVGPVFAAMAGPSSDVGLGQLALAVGFFGIPIFLLFSAIYLPVAWWAERKAFSGWKRLAIPIGIATLLTTGGLLIFGPTPAWGLVALAVNVAIGLLVLLMEWIQSGKDSAA